MPIASAQRFRLILGLAKRVIFAVDKIPFAVRIPYRQTEQPRFSLAVPDEGELARIRHMEAWFVRLEQPRAAVCYVTASATAFFTGAARNNA